MIVKLCKVQDLDNSTDMMYQECQYSSFKKCTERFNIAESTLPVLEIKIHDTAFVRSTYGHAMELSEYQSITGNYDKILFSTVRTAVLGYEVLNQSYAKGDIDSGVYFSSTELKEITNVPEGFLDYCQSFLDLNMKYFILVQQY